MPFYSDGTGPADLDSFAGDLPKLRKLCEKHTFDELWSAHYELFVPHHAWRAIVREAIDRRQSAEGEQTSQKRHLEALAHAEKLYLAGSVETAKVYRMTVWSVVIALIALAILAFELVKTYL